MEVKVVCRYAKISPRKVRLVVDLIRGAGVDEALNTLRLTRKRASVMVAKLLRSAVASAAERFDVEAEDLVVKRAWVDTGPTAKGWRARARGMASRLHHRTSHIVLVVATEEETDDKVETAA